MDIIYNTTLAMSGNCSASEYTFDMAATESLCAVYGSPFGSTADSESVMSVDENGVPHAK